MTAVFVVELAGPAIGAGIGSVLLERWHRARRYARTLRHIDELEFELGISSPSPTPTHWSEASERYASIYASTAPAYYMLPSAPRSTPAPPRVVSEPARGYDGPALTDADVRRLEHPDEFA